MFPLAAWLPTVTIRTNKIAVTAPAAISRGPVPPDAKTSVLRLITDER